MQDFRAHLGEQLGFLTTSAQHYDAGVEAEAKRLAATIRILVHDSGRGTSLLNHLGVKRSLGFIDRGPPEPPPSGHVLHFGVCIVRMHLRPGGDVQYIPVLDAGAEDRMHPNTSFDDWWLNPMLRDQEGNKFNRRDLVLALANKDGGAHIDEKLDAAYRALTRENSLGFTQGDDQRPISNSVVGASVRHIAWELERSIQTGLRWAGDQAVVAQPVCPLRLENAPVAGRNNRCPCGSGRKYKHCFGLRQPRLRMSQPSADSAPQGRPEAAPDPPLPPGQARIDFDCLILVPMHEQRRVGQFVRTD